MSPMLRRTWYASQFLQTQPFAEHGVLTSWPEETRRAARKTLWASSPCCPGGRAWLSPSCSMSCCTESHLSRWQPRCSPARLARWPYRPSGRRSPRIGQYILPLFCLAGAGISAWKRREHKVLVENVVQSKSADALDGMTWQQFEQLVGEAFRLQGYSVAEAGGGGADGGVDVCPQEGQREVPRPVQAVARVQGRRRCRARALWRDGREGCSGWVRRHVWPIHRGSHQLRERSKCQSDRRAEAPRSDRAGTGCAADGRSALRRPHRRRPP